MSVQQLGQYIFDLGFFLGFLHSGPFQMLSATLEAIGLGLEGGSASFSVKIGNAVQVGEYILGLGYIFAFFKFLAPAEQAVMAIGTALAAGAGSFGPIRVGQEGISGVVQANGDGSDTVTFTIAAWPA